MKENFPKIQWYNQKYNLLFEHQDDLIGQKEKISNNISENN